MEKEFHKEKTLVFDEEMKTSQEVKAWFLNTKNFEMNEFLNNMKVKMAIYNFFGKASLWWDNHSKLKKI
jgi:hypothetical protein